MLEGIIKDKDAEIEELRKEKQDFMSKVKELEAELVSLRKSAIHTISSSIEKKEPPTSLLAKLPTRPSSPKNGQKPTSLFANLPARPAFTGFDTPGGQSAAKPSLFAPTVSPRMLPPQQTPNSAGIAPTFESTIPPTLPRRLGRRQKGIVPPLLPHHQSFGAVSGPSPPSTASTLFQNLGRPNISSGDMSGSASFGTSAAKGNSYHNGPTFQRIPLPPVSSPTLMSSTVPASFNFNQQDGILPL